MDLAERVAARLRAIRHARGWSQEDAAAELEMQVRMLSRIENAQLDLRLSTVQRICAKLGLEPGQLLRRPAKRPGKT